VRLLIEMATDLLAGAVTRRIVGVGVAVVGLVRASDGVVRLAPNLGWSDVPLRDLVHAGLGLDVSVSVGNEADLGGLVEHLRGAARGHDSMIYLSGEVGLGGGIIVGGRPLVGMGGYAGEIGHIIVNPSGVHCACGATGCWETEVGQSALLRAAGIPVSANSRRTVDRVFEAAAMDEPVALRAVHELGRWLGLGLANLVNTLNPSVIVLGGFYARLAPLVNEVVLEELSRRALPAAREGLVILPGQYGLDAPLYGAGEVALERLLADPTMVDPVAPSLPARRGRTPKACGSRSR
jgi:predicted NBD/HSP70 family sugar kinase